MNNDEIQPLPLFYNEDKISLPLEQNDFKDFIVSLLGKPESIEGKIHGAFKIDLDGFKNLNHQLDNRIFKQNNASRLEFNAILFFDDDSSMSFNGFESFNDCDEIESLTCEGFLFTWSYLVKFNNKSHSERQEVSIFSVKEETDEFTEKSRFKELESLLGIVQPPKINYAIRYTDRGWGIDISELIRKCLGRFINNSVSFLSLRKILIKNFQFIYIAFFLFWMIIIMSVLLIWNQSLLQGIRGERCDSLSEQVEYFLNSGLDLEKKVDFIINLISQCHYSSTSSVESFFRIFSQVVLLIATMLLTASIPFIVRKLIELPSYRFILFTKESERKYKTYLRRKDERKSWWISSVLTALLIGILASYIFGFLSS